MATTEGLLNTLVGTMNQDATIRHQSEMQLTQFSFEHGFGLALLEVRLFVCFASGLGDMKLNRQEEGHKGKDTSPLEWHIHSCPALDGMPSDLVVSPSPSLFHGPALLFPRARFAAGHHVQDTTAQSAKQAAPHAPQLLLSDRIDLQVRQLAAVLCRHYIDGHWSR